MVGIGGFPDRNNVVVTCGLMDGDHIPVLSETISDVRQGTPLNVELQNGYHVVAQLAVVDDRSVFPDDTVLLEIRDVVQYCRHRDIQVSPERAQ